jgi:hypothetical protein
MNQENCYDPLPKWSVQTCERIGKRINMVNRTRRLGGPNPVLIVGPAPPARTLAPRAATSTNGTPRTLGSIYFLGILFTEVRFPSGLSWNEEPR